MLVHVDTSAIDDPTFRFRRAAKALGITHDELLGRCLRLWAVCFKRRTEFLPELEIDLAAGLDGFGAALIAGDLADRMDDLVRVRGVYDRLSYLESQHERGVRSGISRRIRSHAVHNRTIVQPKSQLTFLEPPVKSSKRRKAKDKPTPKLPKLPPPREAMRLADLLANEVERNHPGMALVPAAGRARDDRVLVWADAIRLMHEGSTKLPYEAIERVIAWSARDTFWRDVILSPKSLRKNWSTMAVRINKEREARRGPTAVGLDRVRMLEEQEARAAVAKPES